MRRRPGRASRVVTRARQRLWSVLGILGGLASLGPKSVVATPVVAARFNGALRADSSAVLTRESLTQLATFWAAFMTEADSIRFLQLDSWGTATVLVAVDTIYTGGHLDRTEWVTHMPALAARYPSVAADLQRAGLTAGRYTTLFATLLNTCRMISVAADGGTLWPPTPREARDLAALRAPSSVTTALLTLFAAHHDLNTPLGIGDCWRLGTPAPPASGQVPAGRR